MQGMAVRRACVSYHDSALSDRRRDCAGRARERRLAQGRYSRASRASLSTFLSRYMAMSARLKRSAT